MCQAVDFLREGEKIAFLDLWIKARTLESDCLASILPLIPMGQKTMGQWPNLSVPVSSPVRGW